MVDNSHPTLSTRRQCGLLRLNRSTFYHQPEGESSDTLALMRRIGELFMERPFLGSRQMHTMLGDEGYPASRSRARRLMRKMGLVAIYANPRTSKPHPAHTGYTYLLRGLSIARSNQAWCADITYLPMKRGYLYLVAIMDWHSRAVLSWQLSNTMDEDFCVSALEDAMSSHGVPEIFNTHQGAQFTSYGFTQTLREDGAHIYGRSRSLDGQRDDRTAVALAEIRMRLPARGRDGK